MGTQIRKVRVPRGSLAERAFTHTDYADAYAVRLPDNVPYDVETLSRTLLIVSPPWLDWLLVLRDRIAGLIGLKTSSHAPRPNATSLRLEPGAQAGIFKVYARSPNELLMGEDDRHLDFRVSLLLREHRGAEWAVVTTVVHFNGPIGRAYFLPVRPFHRLIVPALMRNMLSTLRER